MTRQMGTVQLTLEVHYVQTYPTQKKKRQPNKTEREGKEEEKKEDTFDPSSALPPPASSQLKTHPSRLASLF